MQYFTVAYPIAWIVWQVKGVLVKGGVVATRVVSESRPKYKY